MRYQRLKQTVLFVGIAFIILYCCIWNIHADTYEDDKITVKHEEWPVTKNGQRSQFNHPYEMVGNVLTNALSYIYYEEKGLLGKKETLRVFQDNEIRKLVPLIVQAFSAATPTQVVTVSSYSKHMILNEQQNYCVMFILDGNLNIVFSRIHMFQTFNDTMSDKKKYTTTSENPVKIKHSRFWKIIPSSGQRLEPAHENWLIIDLSNDIYQQPVAKRVGTVDEKIKEGASELDTRLKKLEERTNTTGIPNQPASTTPAQEIHDESRVKSRLLLLRELVNDGVISEDDYNYKKTKMLSEAMSDMSIKERLQKIKELKSEGLITEDDYNAKKKELIDQF